MKAHRYCIFSKQLYTGEGLHDLRRIKHRILHGAGQIGIYLIAEAPENRDELAIIHAGFLTQDYYRTHPLRVYGIARGMAQAQALLVKISDEALANGHPGRLKAYLDEREAGDRKDGP